MVPMQKYQQMASYKDAVPKTTTYSIDAVKLISEDKCDIVVKEQDSTAFEDSQYQSDFNKVGISMMTFCLLCQ